MFPLSLVLAADRLSRMEVELKRSSGKVPVSFELLEKLMESNICVNAESMVMVVRSLFEASMAMVTTG